MLFDDKKKKGGDDDNGDVPAGNEEAVAGPEAGIYDNPGVPGESEGISNAQQ